jgi:thiamine-monophosphate kinase
MSALNEFEQIARLFRPLTRGAPEALELLDDAAVLAARPGYDLVITKDAMVAGVHFLATDPYDLVARKLLRANLSDLAAKTAQPFGYFLMTAWPEGLPDSDREAFARGLAEDGVAFDLSLLGGDTVSTPGPLTLSMTLLGWVPAGGMVRRSGARVGDFVHVSGTIGDGFLGLKAARGEIDDPWLADRYRLPRPRLDLATTLQAHASATADVSDGLIADAGHSGLASKVALVLDLDMMPLSSSDRTWLGAQSDHAVGLVALASGGDDYEVVCTSAAGSLPGLTQIGRVEAGEGVQVQAGGRLVSPGIGGWQHG